MDYFIWSISDWWSSSIPNSPYEIVHMKAPSALLRHIKRIHPHPTALGRSILLSCHFNDQGMRRIGKSRQGMRHSLAAGRSHVGVDGGNDLAIQNHPRNSRPFVSVTDPLHARPRKGQGSA